ncbi:BTAD domain-containing putative transcriptional regulator [Chelativorans salis]|uniref:Transcriptional regulator n=1 Tax=Chelativorans salis TaxID=2978478 RepID=A0ABT2LI34_9HYPH|nr:BTAD domain-containing putative transcriptional regulator [Chelativorans sp. EGI FJ00035]MCT7374175.1 transcriptional regulator [Chelativorans sp. EGI FJ00035]
MLGPLRVDRADAALDLPASRKVRALLAYLALASRKVSRTRLCELFWDVPNDPRGELRWCLSKLRHVLDEPERHRVLTSNDMVSLDLRDCFVDVIEIAAAASLGIEKLDEEGLRTLSDLFSGDFMEGLEIDRSPQFDTWLATQRRRFRACHMAVLEHLIERLPVGSEEIFPLLDTWIELAPFDARAHLTLLRALSERGKLGDCEEHLTATAKLYEAEELDFGPIREAWRTLRDRRVGASCSIEAAPAGPVSTLVIGASPRASLAVMPFIDQAKEDDVRGGPAEGLTQDIITRLAKLRSLFVIARGSVFALAERNIGPEEAARMLNVDYFASGTVRRQSGRLIVTVELVEARTVRIVWAETFDYKADDAFLILDEVGNRIVSSIANEIEVAERNRAILKPPSSLNAWEAYHRGLWHMYRFTKTDNEQAAHFFETAVRLDPTFARAHAGVSFTHWQNAFQHWADRQRETDLAFEAAGRSLIVDEHDPAAHWAMGRALWLCGRQDESLGELEQAVDLSPNFALGHYALSFVQSQSGDARAAIGASDHSRSLSPFDPLLFGMLGARAMAHVRLGEFEQAAEWALRAAARPNAHVIIRAIAAHCLALAGRVEEGQAYAQAIHETLPTYGIEDFLSTFRFSPDAEALFRRGAKRVGLG